MKTGRPRKEFNWDVLDALTSLGASETYIAKYLLKKEGISPHEINRKMINRTIKMIERRIKERWGGTFVEFKAEMAEEWNIELTQLQRASARQGKIDMLKWLGIQDLGQTQKIEQKNENTVAQVTLTLPANGSESPDFD
jgi:hypothetical protein